MADRHGPAYATMLGHLDALHGNGHWRSYPGHPIARMYERMQSQLIATQLQNYPSHREYSATNASNPPELQVDGKNTRQEPQSIEKKGKKEDARAEMEKKKTSLITQSRFPL